ncbi:hypothetical protein TSAR_009558 [Trichomalopsis sarcophagae]|uniref:DUF4371 domain-containing protein n=1 Tax=Trichomalopsis sarcophagae TaxID=543379 RepID=A0A232ET15_9HYME|nr:hypothetical protein TSAR_009558 [Trichomalopsis sarcophagae]
MKKHLDNIEAAKRLGTFVTTNVEEPSFRDRHNVGIRLVDDLVSFMNSMCIDPEAVQSIKLKEDECSQLMKVRPSATLKFCVSVQYFSKIKSKVVQHLLQLIKLDGKNGTALDIFKDFKAFFDSNNVNMQNIVALACDNANIMTDRLVTEEPK